MERNAASPVDGAISSSDDASVKHFQIEEEYSVLSDTLRLRLTYLLGFINTLSTLTTTIYFPLIPLLSAHFSTSIQAINLTVTLYAVCQAVSPPLFASLADCYGRRPVLLALIAIYMAASLGLALDLRGGSSNNDNSSSSSSYGVLLGMRALQSVGGSATSAIAYGIVADVTTAPRRGRMLGPMLSLCNGIASLGPVVGGAVAQGTGRCEWVFLLLLAVGAASLALAGLLLPETARSIVGNGSRRPEARGSVSRLWWGPAIVMRSSGEQQHRAEAGGLDDAGADADSVPCRSSNRWTMRRAFYSLRIPFYPDAAAVLCVIATSYSVYYTFQVAISVIYQDLYGFDDFETGLTFVPGLVGMTVGGMVASKLVDRNFAALARERNIDVDDDRRKADDLSDFPIEAARYRNILAFLGAEVALVVGYGWAVLRGVHPAVPLTLQFFICALSTVLSYTASALLVDVFPDSSSTSYASGQIMRCGLSAASAAMLEPLVQAVGRGWYFTMFGLVVGASGLLSVSISRKKGMAWRQKRQGGRSSTSEGSC